jgi:hypothetical protein
MLSELSVFAAGFGGAMKSNVDREHETKSRTPGKSNSQNNLHRVSFEQQYAIQHSTKTTPTEAGEDGTTKDVQTSLIDERP